MCFYSKELHTKMDDLNRYVLYMAAQKPYSTDLTIRDYSMSNSVKI